MRPNQDLATAGGILLSRVICIPFTHYTRPTDHLAIGAITAGLYLLVAAGLRARRINSAA